MVKGKRISNAVQAAEKWCLDLRLEARNQGGPSSQPVPDNIHHLANALVRISQLPFPLKTNEVTRAHFAGMANIDTTGARADLAKVGEDDQQAMRRITPASPAWNSMLRTTCVATMPECGHAPNALPQLATANVNCRLQPDETLEPVMGALKKAVAGRPGGLVDHQQAGPFAGLAAQAGNQCAMFRVTDGTWPGCWFFRR
jgi:acetylornithine deacetylase/succinyl-diaminopimelate desuccinylase-like protein